MSPSASNVNSYYQGHMAVGPLEEVFLHARDPYKRVDVMPSSRRVRVVMGAW